MTSISEQVYRCLLYLYPRGFRELFADEMVELFRDRQRVAARGRGVAHLWLRTLRDLLVTASQERWDQVSRWRRARCTPSQSHPRPGKDAMISSVVKDVQFAARAMIQRPVWTAAIVLTLALGIGVNSAVFSIVDAVLLKQLPFQEPDRLIMVWNRYDQSSTHSSPPDFIDRRDRSEQLEALAAVYERSMNFSGVGEPQQVQVARVTSAFFDVLGVEPIVGQPDFPHEQSGEDDRIIVLSHGFWQRRFGGELDVSGRTLRLNEETYRVSGVMPRGFDFPSKSELWIPLTFTAAQASDDFRGNEYLAVVARLKDGVSIEQARAEMDVIAASVLERVPERRPFLERNGWGASVVTLEEELLGEYRPALLILWCAVALVLLIACANVANLLLVGAAARGPELAVRTWLGASRGRLLRQLLTESALLASLGTALGLALAYSLVRLLPGLAPTEIPRLDGIGLDGRVLAFTAFVGLATGLLFGLAPAWRAGRFGSERAARFAGRAERRWGAALVVNEVALALVLMVGAGLLLRSFHALTGLDPGFEARDRFTVRLTLPTSAYPEVASREALADALLSRLRALPGVRAAGASFRLPLDDNRWTMTFYPEGYETTPGTPTPSAAFNTITPDYLKTVGIPLLQGRDFDTRDDREAELVVLIDSWTAERFWPGGDAVGSRINLSAPNSTPKWRTIAGVVGHVRNDSLDERGRMQIYFAATQDSWTRLSFTVHSERSPIGLEEEIRRTVAALAPELPVYGVQTLSSLVADSVSVPRFNLTLLAGFAALALLLAAVGLYGVVSYSISRRSAEIGVRMALGAGTRTIFRMVLREGLSLVIFGLGLGSVAAFLLRDYVASLLYQIRTTDGVTFAGTFVLLLAVAFAATWLPARRAARLDPVRALRD